MLPEDDANRKLAVGFRLHFAVDTRYLQVLPVARGWHKVVERFLKEHSTKMLSDLHTHVVLLLDFDGKQDGTKRCGPRFLMYCDLECL